MKSTTPDLSAAASAGGASPMRVTSWMSLNVSSYLPDDAPARLRRYKYHAEDRSLIYRHIWRPLCAWAATKCPVWLAANVITVGALLGAIFTHCLVWFVLPYLTVPCAAMAVKGELSEAYFRGPAPPAGLPTDAKLGPPVHNSAHENRHAERLVATSPGEGGACPISLLGTVAPPSLRSSTSIASMFWATAAAAASSSTSQLGHLMSLSGFLGSRPEKRAVSRAPQVPAASDELHGVGPGGIPFGDLDAMEQLNRALPGWVFVAAGLMLLLYQFLDNLDGHQARRTGMGSPLGLLMDHGCDAFNACVGSLSVAAAVACGPTWKSWAVMTSAVVVFFCHTWEEYYRGSLVLPLINAPNEGILLAVCVYLFTAMCGPAFWLQVVTITRSELPGIVVSALDATDPYINVTQMMLQPSPAEVCQARVDAGLPPITPPAPSVSGAAVSGANCTEMFAVAPTAPVVGLQLNTVFVMFMVLGGFISVLGHISNVYDAVSRNPTGYGTAGTGWLLRRFPFAHALTRLMPIVMVTLLGQLWFLASPTRVFEAHPRLFCWTIGLLFTKLSIHLMVAHICDIEFRPLRRTLIPFLYVGVHLVVTALLRSRHFSGFSSGAEIQTVADAAEHSTGCFGDESLPSMFSDPFGICTFASAVSASVVAMADAIRFLGTSTFEEYFAMANPQRFTSSGTPKIRIVNPVPAGASVLAGVRSSAAEVTLLYEFFALSSLTLIHLAVNVILETAVALKVPIFSVPQANVEATMTRLASEREKTQS